MTNLPEVKWRQLPVASKPPSESMVERVAKAICEGCEGNLPWDRQPESCRAGFRSDARAAIEAMREPTAAMEWAALSGQPGMIWRRMVAEALR